MNGGKSDMHPEPVDEMVLVEYLLGRLSEAEQVQVEDRAFADPHYLGELEAAEADLIDSYVRGDLSQKDRRAFEGRFLTSPGRRGKVEFARAFARATAELKAVEAAARPSPWRMMFASIREWNPALRLAAGTAAVVLATGGAWIVEQNASMRARVAELESQSRTIQAQSDELRRQLAEQAQRPSPDGPRALIPSLVLLPGLSRAETRVKELELNPAAPVAHIEIQVEARDDYPQFRAELRTRSGAEVLTGSGLRRQRNGEAYTISFDVPASALAAGDYEIALKGMPAGKAVEDIGYYYFRVVKR
jgi:hypothetical protein